MTKIAPQALAVKPSVAPEAGRLGVCLVGVGGYGVDVVDRLLNRFQGQPEQVGLHPVWIDAVRNDAYATSSGPFGPSFNSAENRFLLSDAPYAPILEDIAAGRPPVWAPPITPAEARQFLKAPLPKAIGFGGQPIPSSIAAHLKIDAWDGRFDQAWRAAKAEDPQAEPVTVVVASLYGGVGVGHVQVILERLQRQGRGNVVVFLALPSHAEHVLKQGQIPAAATRGIANLRSTLRPGLSQLLVLVGSGNNALVRDPRAGSIEAVSSAVAAWLENPGAFRGELATFLGSDLQGAAPAEKISALGAAEMVFPGTTMAQEQAALVAGLAWRQVTEIGSVELEQANRAGTELAWSDPLTTRLREVLDQPNGLTAVARFEDPMIVEGQLRAVLGWLSTPLPDTEPIEPVPALQVLDGQPVKMDAADLVRLLNGWMRDEGQYVDDEIRKARTLHETAFVGDVRARLRDDFAGDNGLLLADQPHCLRRAIEVIGTVATQFERVRDRIESDVARAHRELQPLERAREAVEAAEQALPARVRVRSRWGGADADQYVAAVQELFDVTLLDRSLHLLADHLGQLAAACRGQLAELESLVRVLDEHAQAAEALAGEFSAQVQHLDGQATHLVVPSTSRGREALHAELARRAAGDVRPELPRALLSHLRVTIHLVDGAAPKPIMTQPVLDSFVAAAKNRNTDVSSTTGSVGVSGTLSVLAASFLPILAHSLLSPQYDATTLADALAVDFSRGWAAEVGGHADQEVIRRFLDEKYVSRLFDAADSTVEVTPTSGTLQPVVRRTVYLDQRPPVGLGCVADGTARSIQETLHGMLADSRVQVAQGAPGRATVTTLVNRIAYHRITELHGRALEHYLAGAPLPVHVDAASRTAHEMERKAVAEGLLHGRLLDPSAVRMLTDANALRAFLGLVATRRMPVAAGNLLDEASITYQLDVAPPGRLGSPQWRVLAPTNRPLDSLREFYDAQDAERLRACLVRLWEAEQAKLVADCGGDHEQARSLVKLALRGLELATASEPDRLLADDLLLIARIDTL